jgi:hypothetical protein
MNRSLQFPMVWNVEGYRNKRMGLSVIDVTKPVQCES